MKKAKQTIILFTIISSIFLSACNQTDSATGIIQDESTSSVSYENEFDETSVMEVSISADPEKWQEMLDNAQNEEYISVDITINGETVENVGIRPKGNSSLSSVVQDQDSDRYSFKIKFDEYVDGQTWQGLDKLVLNANYSDKTSMKEYLSYDIMNFIGVDSPLYSYADISVNDETWGLYLAIEEVDSSFLMRLKNEEGELYKPEAMEMDAEMMTQMGNGNPPQNDENQSSTNTDPTTESKSDTLTDSSTQTASDTNQPPTGDANTQQLPPDMGEMPQGGGMMNQDQGGVSLVYTDDSEDSYWAIFDNAETKTDEKDHAQVIEAIKNLNEGTNLEEYIDVDSVLRYLAAHTVVVNLDSYSSNMAHNYYLYENNGQLSIIPWDYNLAFGGFQSNSASDVVNFPIDTPVSGVSMEDRPLISKLLEVPEYMEKYHEYLKEIVDGYFLDGKFEQKVDEIDGLISDYVENDPTAFYTFDEYQTAIVELKKLGALRGESISGQLDGTVPSTTDSQTSEPDKLIDAQSVDMNALGDMGNMGNMPNMPENMDRETMFNALEIIGDSTMDTLTDEQKNSLYELGLTDENIEQIIEMATNFPTNKPLPTDQTAPTD